jgi:uncharacterized protein YsxB (DUF464 family)
MINITIYKNAEDVITGFKVSGHAGYANAGSDIVCSAVSALVINTINSIGHFTSDRFSLDQDEKKGLIEFHMISQPGSDASLLLNSLALGLNGVMEEYSDSYIRVTQVKSN